MKTLISLRSDVLCPNTPNQSSKFSYRDTYSGCSLQGGRSTHPATDCWTPMSRQCSLKGWNCLPTKRVYTVNKIMLQSEKFCAFDRQTATNTHRHTYGNAADTRTSSKADTHAHKQHVRIRGSGFCYK